MLSGYTEPAEYTCLDALCDLKLLCSAHVLLHKRRGHAVTLQVGNGDGDGGGDKAPNPSTLLGVTHCSKPEHAGPEGCLMLVCRQCDMLLCQGCIGDHVNAGHRVNTINVVGKEQTSAISDALPNLRQGLDHQVAQAAAARTLLQTLALNRSVALEELSAATARLHAAVDARQAALVRAIDAAYDAKVEGLQRELSAALAAVAELATVVATAEAGLSSDRSTSVTRIHVGRSVHTSLALARCRDTVDVNLGVLAFEDVSHGDPGLLGKVLTCALKTFEVGIIDITDTLQ